MLTSKPDAEEAKRAAARSLSESSLSDASSGSSSDSDTSSDSDSSSSSSTSSDSKPLVKAKSKPGPNPKSKLGPGRSERSGSAEPRHDSHRPRKNHTGLKDLSSPRTGTLFAVNPPGKKRRPLAFHAVNVQDRSGQTPVFRYCDHGDIDAVQQLIDAGADINIKDNGGWTPLHKAAVAGHLELASLLIKYGADVNAASNCLDTPLHDAAENGYVDVVQKLLQSGAYLNARNNKNETAHDVAGDEETTECLKKWEEMVCKVNVADAEGRIPLHLAAASGNVPEIMTQIFYGANIRRKDNGGYSPLHLASLYGHLDAAHHLLRLGSEVASASEESETPLMDAAINGHSKVVGLLLSYGADAQHRSKDGKAPEDECTDEACLELLRRPRDSWKPFVEPEWMLRPFPGSASEVMELREPRVGAEAEDHHAATHKQPNGVGAAHHHGRRGAPGRPRAGSLVSESGSHTSGTGGHGTGSENGRSAKGHHSTLREASQLGWGFAWFDAAKDVAVTREERKLQALMKIIDKQEGKVPGEAGAGPVGKPGESHKAKPHHSDKDSLVESHETKPKKTKEKEKEKAEKRKEKELKRAEKEKEREEKKKRKEKKKERDPNETPKKRGRPPKSAAVSTDVSPNTQLRMEEDEQLEILKRELQQIEEKQRSSREGSYDFDEWGSGSKKKGKGKKPKSASKVKGEPMDGGSALPSSAIKRGPGRPPKSSSPIKKDEDISDDEDEPHGVKREREGRGNENPTKRARRRSLSPVIESAPAARRGRGKLNALASLFGGDGGSSAEDEPERVRSPMLDALLEHARMSGDIPDNDVDMDDARRDSDDVRDGSDTRMKSRDSSPAKPSKKEVKAKAAASVKAASKAEKQQQQAKAAAAEKEKAAAAEAARKAAIPKPKPKPPPVKVNLPPPEPVVVARAKKKKVSLLGNGASTPRPVDEPPQSASADGPNSAVDAVVVAAAVLLNQVHDGMDVDVSPSVAQPGVAASIPDPVVKTPVDVLEVANGPLPSLPKAEPVVPATESSAVSTMVAESSSTSTASTLSTPVPPPIYIPKISVDEATALAALTALHDHSVVSAGGSPPAAGGEGNTPPLTNQSSTSSNTSEPVKPGGYVHKLKRLPPNKRFEEPATAK